MAPKRQFSIASIIGAPSADSGAVRRYLILHYSDGDPKCEICGESRYACLDLDHPEGGGNFHRRHGVKGARGDSARSYREVVKWGCPEGFFRVLCRNCNWIEHLNRKVEGK